MNPHLEWLLSSAMDSKRQAVARVFGMADVSPMVAAEGDDELLLVSCAHSEKSELWQVAAAVATVAVDVVDASGLGLVIESLTKTVRRVDHDPERDPLHDEFMHDPASTVSQCLVAFWAEHGEVSALTCTYHYDDGAVIIFDEPRAYDGAGNDPASLAAHLARLTSGAPRMRAMVDRESFATALRGAGHAVEFVERG